MAIFLVYSTSGITSGKKVCRELKMAAILKIFKYWTQLQFDLRYEKSVPNYANFFMVMTSSMTSQGGLKVSLYIHVWERLAPGVSCKGNVSSINADIVIVFLGYTCQRRSQRIILFEIAGQRSTSQAYWVTLALKRPKLCQSWDYQDETKTEMYVIVICSYSNHDSVSLTVCKIAWCRIWWPYWMVVQLEM